MFARMLLGDESLFTQIETLRIEREALIAKDKLQSEKLALLQDEVSWLREQLASLNRAKFGRKSEKWESPEQGLLFNEAEAESPDSSDEDVAEADTPSASPSESIVGPYTRKRGYRRPLPDNLEREVIKVELPFEEQFAEDGSLLKVIGWSISEKLKYQPAQMTVLQYHRAKYGVDSGDYVKTAAPVPSIIPKGLATPELLAAVCVAKYADGLPLYRLEDIFKRHGIDLKRTTLARWMIALGQACQPIWNVLSERWRESFYVACDETKVQVLKENGRRAESKSWMIVRATPFGPKKVVLFDYSPSRASEVMKGKRSISSLGDIQSRC